MVKKNFLIKNILQNFRTHIKTRTSARKSERSKKVKKNILIYKKLSQRKKLKGTKIREILKENIPENSITKEMISIGKNYKNYKQNYLRCINTEYDTLQEEKLCLKNF